MNKEKLKIPKLRFKEFSGEWEEKKVGEIMECIVPGRNKPQNFDGEIPWITTPDISNRNVVNYSKTGLSLSIEEIKKVGAKIIPKNSIIMSCVGELGVICIAGADIVINQQLHAFLPNKNVNNIFVKNALLTKINYMETVATKTAVLYMNKETCNSIPVFSPSLPEQQKIANFLSLVDEKIEKLTKKKELLEQYKKGVMQKIFSQEIRFKDDNGNDFPEWEEKFIDEIFTVTRGYVLSSRDTTSNKTIENTYPVYSSQTKNKGLMGYYNTYLYENAITWTTDGANAGDVNFREGKFYCTNVCGVLLNEQGYANTCIAEMLNTVTHKYVSYVGNPKLMNNVMSKIQLLFPSVPEQQKIADFLSVLDKKIDIVSQELVQVQEFKKGLLQQMFV